MRARPSKLRWLASWRATPLRSLTLAVCLLSCGAFVACSGADGTTDPGGGAGPPNVTVAVTPASAQLQASETQSFSAGVTGSSNSAVTWTATAGTVTGSGSTITYTAPAAPGSYTVTATSVANTTRAASATITVTASASVSVDITPQVTQLNSGESRLFGVAVNGSPNTAVTWTATSGTIVGTGDVVTYTAPPNGGTVTVRATSVADPSRSAAATITVVDPATGGTSAGQTLLADAYASGALDLSTYVLYQAYWAFGDPRLPSQYRGLGMGAGDLPDDIIRRPDGLSAAVSAELDRFALPPDAPGSWYVIRNTPPAAHGPPATISGETAGGTQVPALFEWRHIISPNGKIKVWWDKAYPGHEAKAQVVVQEVDVMYNKYAVLLGREPLSDAAIATDKNGGDGLLDIYLTGTLFTDNGYGMTMPYETQWKSTRPCTATPAFMLLNARRSNADIMGTVAHELFHAFQMAFTSMESCGAFNWLMESTAAWSEDYAFPASNTEWIFADFLTNHHERMRSWDERGYAAFVYFMYLTRTYSPQIMRTIFDGVGSKSSFDAIDAAVLGGIPATWKEFVVAGFNQPPFDKFNQWDGKRFQPQTRDMVGPATTKLPVYFTLAEQEDEAAWNPSFSALGAPSVDYYWFSRNLVSAHMPDFIQMNNPFGGSTTPAGYSVQLLYRRGTEPWQLKDLTGTTDKKFCVTKPEEDFDEFVLIVANGNKTAMAPEVFGKPVAQARAKCDQKQAWRLTAITKVSEVGNVNNNPEAYWRDEFGNRCAACISSWWDHKQVMDPVLATPSLGVLYEFLAPNSGRRTFGLQLTAAGAEPNLSLGPGNGFSTPVAHECLPTDSVAFCDWYGYSRTTNMDNSVTITGKWVIQTTISAALDQSGVTLTGTFRLAEGGHSTTVPVHYVDYQFTALRVP